MPLARSAVHVDSVLSNLAREFKFPDMIAEDISPRVKVRKDSDLYYTFGREEQRLKADGEGDLKAKCSPAVSFDWAPTGTEPYVCRARAIKDMVCDATIRNADNPVRPVRRTIEKLTRNLQLHRERRVAKLFTAPSAASTTPAIKWDSATADIEDDIRAAKEIFRVECGGYPNYIIMSATVAGYVRLFLKAAAEISFMEKATIYKLPDELWGMKVAISEATMNTAAEGLAEVMTDIWPDTVTLAYINPTKNPSLQDSTYSWTFESVPFRVRRWRDEEIEATMYEVQQCIDEKVVAPFAYHTIEDVLTP
jgi:hypothetical protein